MKKKGVINYGSRRSAKPPGGLFVSRGPHTILPVDGFVGFSINGGTRSQGYIGQSSAFSKHGTPFYGQYPQGYGGIRGTYPTTQPTFNSPIVKGITRGKQYEYIKPSVLSTRGMIETRFKWIHNGVYPNYWVQPVYPSGSLEENSSQGLYIHKKEASNDCHTNVNNTSKYIDYRVCKGNSYNSIQNQRPSLFTLFSSGYTKELYQPITSSQQTLKIQRRCSNPIGVLKPFPFASNGGTSNSRSGINYAPPPIQQIYYTKPPAWYWTSGSTSGV
jgi:hypothetical protein